MQQTLTFSDLRSLSPIPMSREHDKLDFLPVGECSLLILNRFSPTTREDAPWLVNLIQEATCNLSSYEKCPIV